MATATIEEALAAIRRGEMVVVVDDESRENEGDLIMGAQFASAEKIAFYLRHTSGLICVALEPKRLEDLNLPLMVNSNTEFQRTAFTVTVDALETSTGISAQDRARTIAALIDPETTPGSLRRPGHVFPLRYCEGGVLTRPGHTEAAIDLARMAGINPAGMLCEIVAADKRDMARMPDLELFAKTHELLLITIADLVKYRRDTERLVERVSTAHIPTELGNFTGHVFRSLLDGEEHFALVAGDVTCDELVLIRVHSECLSGDIFHSLRCDCGAQLEAARTAILAEGRGVIIYLRGGVGRGIGLAHTFSTCSVQRKEFTRGHVDLQLGLTGESGAYWTASQILMDLNVRRWKLMDSPAATCGGIGKFKDEEALIEQVAAPEVLIKAARPAASG